MLEEHDWCPRLSFPGSSVHQEKRQRLPAVYLFEGGFGSDGPTDPQWEVKPTGQPKWVANDEDVLRDPNLLGSTLRGLGLPGQNVYAKTRLYLGHIIETQYSNIYVVPVLRVLEPHGPPLVVNQQAPQKGGLRGGRLRRICHLAPVIHGIRYVCE